MDVGVAVDLLDGRLEHVAVEVLERGVLAGLDAQKVAPPVEGDPAGRADLAEADAVLVEGERVAGPEPFLDGQVDPGVDLGVVELAAEVGGVGVAADAALDDGLGEERRDSPLLGALGVQDVPGDGRARQRLQGLAQQDMVVGVKARDLGERPELDLVLEDLRVGQVLVGAQEQDVGDLPLQERELALDVDGADVLFQLAARGQGQDLGGGGQTRHGRGTGRGGRIRRKVICAIP